MINNVLVKLCLSKFVAGEQIGAFMLNQEMLDFPELGEFKFVKKVLKDAFPLQKNPPRYRDWLSAGDDCAIFDGWLATKDMSVENVHFRMDWSSPEQAVEKHIVSNVSDISSMGGVPRIALLGLCVNKNWSADIRNRVAAAFSEGFAKRGITLIGGDTVSGDVGMFSTTLLGALGVNEPLLRRGACPGDAVCVAGTLGKSAAGLWVLMNHPEDKNLFPDLVEYHLSPRIKEMAGAELLRCGVRGAAMDVSDGLSSELNHLALSSKVSIEILQETLPVDPSVVRMAEYYGLSPMNFVMNGGEEYELLFTAHDLSCIARCDKSKTGEIYRIGTVLEGKNVYIQQTDGSKCIVNAQSWSHL